MQISSCVASLGPSCLSVRAWALMRDADTRDSKYENRRWAWLREQTRKFRRCHRVCVCVCRSRFQGLWRCFTVESSPVWLVSSLRSEHASAVWVVSRPHDRRRSPVFYNRGNRTKSPGRHWDRQENDPNGQSKCISHVSGCFYSQTGEKYYSTAVNDVSELCVFGHITFSDFIFFHFLFFFHLSMLILHTAFISWSGRGWWVLN